MLKKDKTYIYGKTQIRAMNMYQKMEQVVQKLFNHIILTVVLLKVVYGNNGNDRGTGSGGQGGTIINGLRGSASSWMGLSTGGNSYSGGNGSGGLVITNSPAIGANATEATAKKGGTGYAWDPNSNISWFAGGGAGITGGNSSYRNKSSVYTDTKGEDGTGGLLMLYSSTLTNFGKISSEGSKGAGADSKTSFTAYWKGSTGRRRFWTVEV